MVPQAPQSKSLSSLISSLVFVGTLRGGVDTGRNFNNTCYSWQGRKKTTLSLGRAVAAEAMLFKGCDYLNNDDLHRLVYLNA